MRALVAIALLIAVALAGCLGDDDPDTDGKNGGGRTISADAGSVAGEIRDTNLDPVDEARIRLIVDQEIAHEGFTNDKGRFNLTAVNPDSYRMQVFAPHCCETILVQLSVGPRAHLNESVLLKPKVPDDGDPYASQLRDANGMISCALNTPTQPFYPCQPYDDNHKMEAGDNIGANSPGLKTIHVALQWGGDFPLRLNVFNNDGGSTLLKAGEGTSPLEVRIDASEIEDEDLKFESYYGQDMRLRFAVEPAEPGVIYQEGFSLFWTYHFWEEASDSFSTIPDF